MPYMHVGTCFFFSKPYVRVIENVIASVHCVPQTLLLLNYEGD